MILLSRVEDSGRTSAFLEEYRVYSGRALCISTTAWEGGRILSNSLNHYKLSGSPAGGDSLWDSLS